MRDGPTSTGAEPNTPTADWRAIRKDVLGQIQSGELPPGTLIPREADMALLYDCSRSTVARALRDLAEAGFLIRRRKGGTTVALNPVRKAPLDVPILSEAIRKAGHQPGYRLLSVYTGLPCPAVGSALGLGPGAPALHVSALYLADETPHQYESRWLNLGAIPGLTPADCVARPVDEWLLRNAPLSRATIRISAVAAPAEVAEALQLEPAAPTLLIERVSHNQNGPIGVLHLYHAAGYRIVTAI